MEYPINIHLNLYIDAYFISFLRASSLFASVLILAGSFSMPWNVSCFIFKLSYYKNIN